MENNTRLMKAGAFTSALTSVLTAVTFVIAYLTPPLSGPLCAKGCFEYPFDGIASRFPRDYIWMYFAFALSLLFVVFMAFIRERAPRETRLFGTLGLAFGAMSSLALAADYFVQLFVIQPSVLAGEADGIALLSQYNSHGVFIALEVLGYLLMSVALFAAAFTFGGSKKERAVKWTFISAFVLNLAAFAWISAAYGNAQEYRFEIASISIGWLALIVSGALLSAVFSDRSRPGR